MISFRDRKLLLSFDLTPCLLSKPEITALIPTHPVSRRAKMTLRSMSLYVSKKGMYSAMAVNLVGPRWKHLCGKSAPAPFTRIEIDRNSKHLLRRVTLFSYIVHENQRKCDGQGFVLKRSRSTSASLRSTTFFPANMDLTTLAHIRPANAVFSSGFIFHRTWWKLWSFHRVRELRPQAGTKNSRRQK